MTDRFDVKRGGAKPTTPVAPTGPRLVPGRSRNPNSIRCVCFSTKWRGGCPACKQMHNSMRADPAWTENECRRLVHAGGQRGYAEGEVH